MPAGPPVVTVRRLADFIRRLVEGNADLRDVRVRGEISNWKPQGNGNVYFDLKDEAALLHCVAWARDAARFPALRDGAAVTASGAVMTYGPRSVYQLHVRAVRPDGIGDLQAVFAERRRLLAADGLFDPARKRPLPARPFCIALVSSRRANGAADVVSVLEREYPHVRVRWCETPVQGAGAGAEIAAAVDRAGRLDVDCVIVTRGGGSFEDLFAFSDEAVVRAIARCPHPVISAVGHTTDQQLCDFAADAHYETPSAAAHALGPSTAQLRERIGDLARRLDRCARMTVEGKLRDLRPIARSSRLSEPARALAFPRQRLDVACLELVRLARRRPAREATRLAALDRRLARRDPGRRLALRGEAMRLLTARLQHAREARLAALRRRRVDALGRLAPAVRALLERAARRTLLAKTRLSGADPTAILARGYAIVSVNGRIVRDPLSVPLGAPIEARLARGTLVARIEERHRHDDQSRG